jgi:hypothetical protein
VVVGVARGGRRRVSKRKGTGGVAVAGRGRLVEGGGGDGEYWVVGRSVAGTARQADGQTATERQAQTGSRQARAVV